MFKTAGIATAAGIVLLAFTACGGSDEAENGSKPASIGSDSVSGSNGESAMEDASGESLDTLADEPVDPDEASARFVACMADQGVEVGLIGVAGGADVPSGEVVRASENEASPEKMEAAERECEPLLDGAFDHFELSPEQEAEQADQMLALQRCLAGKGFDIDLQGDDFIQAPTGDLDRFDAAFKGCIDAVRVGQPLEVGP